MKNSLDMPLAKRHKPWLLAAVAAGIYFVLSAIYIVFSSQIATSFAQDLVALENIEIVKGIMFVLTSATLIFFGLFILFSLLRQKELMIEQQRQMFVASEKRAAAGVFASSIAHDLNNELTILQYCVDEVIGFPALADQQEIMDDLKQSTAHIRDYSRHLAAVSGKDILTGMRSMDIAGMTRDIVNLARTHNKVKYCTVELEAPEALTVDADASLLHRSLLNLMINAGDATEGRGRILVKLFETKKSARIEIHDDGPGIPREQRAQVLEPFYTTKQDGSGLGLMSVKYCADIHKGALGIEDSELGGVCFFIEIPRKQEPSEQQAASSACQSGNLKAADASPA
mgnify:CR=1 FL=1